MQPPAIALLTPNVLMGVGLKTILEKIIPMAEVSVYASFDAFAEADPERFYHYFVAAQLFLPHAQFFRERNRKTILLTDSRVRAAWAGMHTLDVFTSEERLVHDILQMHRGAHPHPSAPMPDPRSAAPLTEREREVLVRIARGDTSRQIAARLDIGLTTVLTHRRNLMEKLGVRSVAELVLCALSAGYVDAEQI